MRAIPIRWTLALAGLALLAVGAGPCDGQLETLRSITGILGQQEERLARVEACTCCCPGVLAPVCAADGRTYVSACEARCAGVEVVASGRCATPTCGGPQGLPCPAGWTCELPPGCDAREHGSCEQRPELCPTVYDPVCGCDGRTYGNDCERRRAGAPLSHRGACEEPTPACVDNDDCADSELCARRAGACEPPGACRARPTACPDVYAPVCGCDGRTHGNACEAAAAGTSIARRGPCEPPPVACRGDEVCGPGAFCAPPDGHCDEIGECRDRPQVCPRIYAPVCGCDGRTHGNACEAAAAGVGVADEGACGTPPRVCSENAECDRNQYCALRPGVCGGPGECTVRPQFCTFHYDPVCGCDGATYGNPCAAAHAGASVASRGPCAE